MRRSRLAFAVLLLPAAGAILLAGRGWCLPRIVTVIVGPGVVWASFAATLMLFFGQAKGAFTYWTCIKSGTFDVPCNLLAYHLSIFLCLLINGVGRLTPAYTARSLEPEAGPKY